MNEAFVTVTMKVSIPVAYAGSNPTASECMSAIKEYQLEHGAGIEDMVKVQSIAVDVDSITIGAEGL